ncbi:uncharacterized protein LOC127130253 [Lathyrus oleraceus]|uniref:uncharacterized protein LOC127130253 n=1 Tax=Pisum sativum TaxID=3888 RepID=UPI0021D3BD92|nr:uncharacterized protein LOC127130253 [Pisum sativum]
MPIYAKFMKDIISKKRSTDTEPIILTETCSAILEGMKIPVKKQDRGLVTIPCTIGDRKFKKALIDLGASVSLMPLSIYKKLVIGSVQDTRMTLQFVDHSVRRPYGIVEDVLVKLTRIKAKVVVMDPTTTRIRPGNQRQKGFIQELYKEGTSRQQMSKS